MNKASQKKKTEIKKALKKGEITKQELDSSCYRIAQRILNGMEVRESSIEKLFTRLQEIRTNNVTEQTRL